MKSVRQILSSIGRLIYKWLWGKPTSEPKAKDITQDLDCFEYKGQKMCMSKAQKLEWDVKYSRQQKRAAMLQTKRDVSKGRIKFVEINGKWVAVKNIDYGKRAEENIG